MNKPIKDWGSGIPKYSKDDILIGLELHEFCTNAVAQSMQDDGFTIEGIIVHDSPTQVIANKDGKRHFVIVAGGVYPDKGKIAYRLKKEYSFLCKTHGIIPMFASVSIMSQDAARAEAALALKHDGYYIKYTGNEDLTNISDPSVDADDYKAYCTEKIILAYRTGRFEEIYDLFADNIEFHSQWVLNPLIGKEAVVEYFNGKGATLRNSETEIDGTVVVITQPLTKNGNFGLWTETGTVCALISQELNGKTNWIFISPKFDENNKLISISLNDPSLFTFEEYYAFS